MGNVLNFCLDDGKYGIKVHPVINNLSGSTTASNLLMKIIAYLIPRGNEEFYKFNSRPEKPNPRYKKKDSWTEELRIKLGEFKGARDRIATRYYKGGTKGLTREEAMSKSDSTALVLYRMDNFNTVWYEINPKYYKLLCADIWGENLFIRPDGEDKSNQELMDMINELAAEYEGEMPGSCEDELEGVEPQMPEVKAEATPTPSPAKKPKTDLQKVEQVMVAGKMCNFRPFLCPTSNPAIKVPHLLEDIPMHDDFSPTKEQNQYLLDEKWEQEEIDALTSNFIAYWAGRPQTKKKGWWLSWWTAYRSEVVRIKKGGGFYVKRNKLNASEKRAEQYRRESVEDNFPDVTD